VSGAFAVFHRSTVIEAGGYCRDTVTEDMDLIVQLHQWAADNNRKIRMSFTSTPCVGPSVLPNLAMLANQRRRLAIGPLPDTLETLGNPVRNQIWNRGWLSFPFHSYVEGLGAAVEIPGIPLMPLAIFLGMVPPGCFSGVLFCLASSMADSFRWEPSFWKNSPIAATRGCGTC